MNQKHEEKYNRTSSDLMDKINQNRHVGGGRKKGEELPPRFIKLPFFYLLIYFPNFTVSWNYGNLTVLFILFIFFFC